MVLLWGGGQPWLSVSLLLHSVGWGAAAASALRERTAYGCLSASATAVSRGAGSLPLPPLLLSQRHWERKSEIRAARPVIEALPAPRDASSDDSGPADR